MNKRQEGYYWVNYKGNFIIAHYWLDEDSWTINFCNDLFADSDFEHINEVRIKQPAELPD